MATANSPNSSEQTFNQLSLDSSDNNHNKFHSQDTHRQDNRVHYFNPAGNILELMDEIDTEEVKRTKYFVFDPFDLKELTINDDKEDIYIKDKDNFNLLNESLVKEICSRERKTIKMSTLINLNLVKSKINAHATSLLEEICNN